MENKEITPALIDLSDPKKAKKQEKLIDKAISELHKGKDQKENISFLDILEAEGKTIEDTL